MEQDILEALPAVRRFAFSLTGSMPDADDLLQSTVEKVLKRPPPEDIPVLKWMFKVCRNCWIDSYRSQQTREKAVSAPELQEATVDGERVTQSEIQLQEVNKAMEKLSDDQRSVISLVAIQGLSYQEASELLDVPPGTIMSRLARARAALAKQLSNEIKP